MFGVLPTNAFHNMKLANPSDKRTFRDFKISLCRYSMLHVHSLGLRERKRKDRSSSLAEINIVSSPARPKKQKRNPFKCKLKDRQRPKNKFAAVTNCSKCGPHRFVRLEDLFPGKRNRVQCKWQSDFSDQSSRCPNYAEVGCVSCGTCYCFDKVQGSKAKTPISHASAAHQPEWFELSGPNAFCRKIS